MLAHQGVDFLAVRYCHLHSKDDSLFRRLLLTCNDNVYNDGLTSASFLHLPISRALCTNDVWLPSQINWLKLSLCISDCNNLKTALSHYEVSNISKQYSNYIYFLIRHARSLLRTCIITGMCRPIRPRISREQRKVFFDLISKDVCCSLFIPDMATGFTLFGNFVYDPLLLPLL